MLSIGSDLIVTNSVSPISFQTEGGGHWKVWDRYIALDGKRAFHIGNVCGTCSFFFERLSGANRSININAAVSKLNEGIGELDAELVDVLKELLPDGRYRPMLLHAQPQLVKPGMSADYFVSEQVALWGLDGFWGLPHNPKTEYYRLGSRQLPEGRGFYEFLVPIFPHNWLKREQVDSYGDLLVRGAQPTAVALGVLDVKQPAVWVGEPDVTSHWCLAHYLLDGHHKVYAASQTGRPCTLLSFLAVEKGISSAEDVNEMVEILKSGLASR